MWSVQTKPFGCLSVLFIRRPKHVRHLIAARQSNIRPPFDKTNGRQKAVSPFVWDFCQYVRRCYQLPSESWRTGDRNDSAIVTLKGDDASPRDKVVLGFLEDQTCFVLTQRWCEESAARCEVTVSLFLIKTHLKGSFVWVLWLHKTVCATGSFFILKSFPQLTLNIKIPLSVIFLPQTTRKQQQLLLSRNTEKFWDDCSENWKSRQCTTRYGYT